MPSAPCPHCGKSNVVRPGPTRQVHCGSCRQPFAFYGTPAQFAASSPAAPIQAAAVATAGPRGGWRVLLAGGLVLFLLILGVSLYEQGPTAADWEKLARRASEAWELVVAAAGALWILIVALVALVGSFLAPILLSLRGVGSVGRWAAASGAITLALAFGFFFAYILNEPRGPARELGQLIGALTMLAGFPGASAAVGCMSAAALHRPRATSL